jgi:hypothetical protein
VSTRSARTGRSERTNNQRHRWDRRNPVLAAQRPRSPWGTIASIVVVALFIAGLTTYFLTQPKGQQGQAQDPPQGVQTFTNLSRDHVTGPVNYPRNPPVGGPHNPVWLNCGTYTSPVANENAVHSLEHGAVWITYQPNLPTNQVSTLRSDAHGQPYVVLSPYPNLPAPVVASAWGVQLRLSAASDPRLTQFIRAYERGPQTPEPGAPCSGGVGTPQP